MIEKNNDKSNKRNEEISGLELLAPAGGMEQLRAAINFGADAVYVGLSKFSMRAKATNFSFDELKEAVCLAHERGVKVHVTLNTQMHEGDITELHEFFKRVQQIGVDAVIVGDLGAVVLARKHAPNVDLHVSTQAAVANSESAKAFYELGAKRVVLAREMTLLEIENFRKKIPADLEVEVFAHGAQCMAQSGRCLISSYLCDGRSANAGACTQPCRWGYHVKEEKRENMTFDIEEAGGLTYLFNAKDLCMIEHLNRLKDAGVDSIKIEGRNKKAFYVATVVNAYRQALDGADPKELMCELDATSHRPFSTGFFFGNPQLSLHFDGYTQTTLHVADVLKCVQDGEEFKLEIRCRNKILDGEKLEALIPDEGIKEVRLSNFFLCKGGDLISQEEVNRPAEIYCVTSSVEVPKNSFLRKREAKTTSRRKSVM